MNENRLITSPFFFVTPAETRWQAIEVSRNERFRRLSPKIFEAAQIFLTPRSRTEAEAAGISSEIIAAAIEVGILVDADDASLTAMGLWEDRNWSRMAYLLFSQQDLSYLEPTNDDPALEDLIRFRRTSIQSYLGASDYKPRHLVSEPLQTISLPAQPRRPEPDLDSLINRRSVRAFSDRPIDIETFAKVLWHSTHFVRIADESKESGDPFYILNSFYTWLEFYVVVQGVDGLHRGVYQYDMNGNKLLAISRDCNDEDLLPCIQHQNWIGGGGFCLFIAVDWMRYLWIYRHARAYVNLIIQLGEIGQEILQTAHRYGLGGWPTPAVHESNCAKLLKLDMDRRDAMYFIKLGPPKGRE